MQGYVGFGGRGMRCGKNSQSRLNASSTRVRVSSWIETIRGRGRGSGVEIRHHQTAMIWTLREGLVLRMEAYPDPQEALEAAGLEG
jgi:ketosteroid isomerase-like protein